MYLILKKIFHLLPNVIKSNVIVRSLLNNKIISNLKHEYLKRTPNLWPSKLEITSIIGCTIYNGVDLCDVCYDGVTIDSKEFLETVKI